MEFTSEDRPFSESERNNIQGLGKLFVDNIDANHELILILISLDCINLKHADAIDECSSSHDKACELFSILQRRSFAQYQKFLEGLVKNDQKYLVPIFAIDKNYPARFENHKNVLRELLEYPFGLLEQLISRQVLNENQVSRITSISSSTDQNEELLNIMIHSKHEEVANFLLSLNKTFQSHLVNYIHNDGDIEYSDQDRPLSEDELNKLQTNYEGIVDNIETNELFLARLVNSECISQAHVDAISNQKSRDKKAGELLSILQRRSVAQYKIFLNCLVENDQGDLNSMENNEIKEEKVEQIECESNLNLRLLMDNPRLICIIPGSRYICGLTVLDNQLFVIRGQSSVNVYNTNIFAATRDIQITGSSSLYAIVASPRYNCLYISDVGLTVVHRYNLSDSVITQWSVGDVSYGLSLTSTHNVLVTLVNTKQIKEYTPDGGLIREISLDSSIDYPRHSVQLTSGQFVVSHGDWDESIQRVCIVNKSGRIIQSYGEFKGSGVGQLCTPSNLAVDRHNNVLVADYANNRVVLLRHSSLKHIGYKTISEYTMNHPHALHLDELTRRLYVGEYTSAGRVLVLTV